MKKINKNKGFTLTELLVAMAVTAIFFAIVAICINTFKKTYTGYNASTQETKEVNDIFNNVTNVIKDVNNNNFKLVLDSNNYYYEDEDLTKNLAIQIIELSKGISVTYYFNDKEISNNYKYIESIVIKRVSRDDTFLGYEIILTNKDNNTFNKIITNN